MDTVEDVRKEDDISTIVGGKHDNGTNTISKNDNDTHGHFTESEETIEDLKNMGVYVKQDIKYYAALSGGAHERMKILHNIHKKWT